MPIYEYICSSCGEETEIIQRFSDPPLDTCQSCSGALEKKISASTFHLKGSGWYVTDYARKSSKADGNGEGQGERKESKKEESKKEESKKEEGKTKTSSSSSETSSTSKPEATKAATTTD